MSCVTAVLASTPAAVDLAAVFVELVFWHGYLTVLAGQKYTTFHHLRTHAWPLYSALQSEKHTLSSQVASPRKHWLPTGGGRGGVVVVVTI